MKNQMNTSPWEFSVSHFLSWWGNGEVIFIQSLGCKIPLYQLKPVQRHSPCFGNRKWEGVLKSFIPHLSHRWVFKLCPSQKPQIWLLWYWFHWATRTESSPQALVGVLDILDPDSKFWTKSMRGEVGGRKKKKKRSLFSHSIWKLWWPVKNHHIFLLGKRNRSTEVGQGGSSFHFTYFPLISN